MNVAVFGLGYVGFISAVCLAEMGHQVVGVDVSRDKVDRINRGDSPITEPGAVEGLTRALAAKRLRATSDVAEAMTDVDVVLICVGTPSDRHGALDCSALLTVGAEIGRELHRGHPFPVVAIRSTVIPGLIRRELIPVLESAGGKAGVDFGVCSNPEFLREGSAIADFREPPFTVIGEIDEQSGARLAALYDTLQAPVIRIEAEAAALVKYASNAYHALKVAFANELGVLCASVGADSHAVMDVFCRDTKLNVSATYLKPGFAFGGSCLPKDLRAVLHYARHADVDLPLLGSVLPSNERHIRRAIDAIIATGHRKIGVFGLSFKSNTDDLRESPLVHLIESLLGRGMDVAVYDEEVRIAKLFGRNREYIERTIPHLAELLKETAEEVVGHGEVIVIGRPMRNLETFLQHRRPGQIVVDLARTPAAATTPKGELLRIV